MKFEKEVTTMFSEVNYHMIGAINELTQFGPHTFSGAETINFFLNKIEMINSTGILNWINWITVVQQRSSRLQITFSGCPKIVIDQMNKVKGFLPDGAIVKSFDIPFYCSQCGKNYPKLITLGKEYAAGTADIPGQIDLKIMSCPKCNVPMEYDFIAERYFKFLAPLLQGSTKKK